MAERHKLIGVCLSQAHNFLNTGFLNELNRAAAKEGCGLIVFNNSMDFYWYQKSNNAPRALFRAIRYELFDAILIIYHTFHDKALVDEIAEGARKHGVPVICAGAELPGCYAILNDYENCFKSVLRHVIRDHGARDTFFIAGMKNESNSEDRLRCYREVLEETGLPVREDRIAYGNYWADASRNIVLKLIRSSEKLPDAIFCANDTMAISVCDTLRENGFRVPEDVIVTGFDGIPAAYMVRPRLTTCSDNPRALAEQTMNLIRRIHQGEEPSHTLVHSFLPVFSESCGCPCTENDRYDALTVYRRSEALNNHENDLYHRVARILTRNDPESFLQMIASSLLPGSVLYLNSGFPAVYSGCDFSPDCLEEDLIAIPHREQEESLVLRPCKRSELQNPEGQELGITVLNTIFSESVVFGSFAAWTTDLDRDAQLIKRVCDVLNLVFNIQLGNARQQILISHLNDTLFLDSVTGLSNLKGLTRWFDSYSAEEANRLLPLSLSVYSIHRYNYIYENYGMNETEEIARLTADYLTAANPSALIVARVSEDQFVVIDGAADRNDIRNIIDKATADFFRNIETYNSVGSKPYFLEINCGCTTMDGGWENATLENLIRLALGELYLNRMRSSSGDVTRPSASASALYNAFNLLMEKSLLKFFFQPIVDAKTAQICAYEALMRTDSLINLSPLEILNTAREYNRLYDVERATLFGIMDRFARNYGDFYGCKVFINTIPGYFLTEEDCDLLKTRYENYLDCFVFELTEQWSTSREEISRLKKLSKPGSTAQIAIDDYGAGHSNIVNVLRYSPEIIKIDRALITDIQSDRNKQLFVRNTIDFAHQNNIRALAEGVETADELRTVIEFGVDLIQGYYTGRPAEKPQAAITESVRNEILEQNLMLARLDLNAQTYTARDGETLDLLNLAVHHYACLQLPEGTYVLNGQKQRSVDIVIQIEEEARVTLTLNDVNLRGFNEPIIQLGKGSDLTLLVEGINTLNKDGILVPASSRLTLRGNGDLSILNNRNYSIGIGANYNDPYGTIVVDLDGTLTLKSSGDRVVCLGGGKSAGEGIHLLRGECAFTGNGISVVAVGSSSGDSRIIIREASLTARVEGNDALAVGSLAGNTEIESSGRLDLTADCERATALGSMSGTGSILLDGGAVSVAIHCDAGACIGTFSGEVTARLRNTVVRVHGEGNRVAGFGSPDGACDTRIESGDIQGEVLAGERLLLGNEQSRVIITGGNVRLFPGSGQFPVSPGGLPLCYQTPDTDHFARTFRDRRGSWTYVADRNSEGLLGVWVPKEE